MRSFSDQEFTVLCSRDFKTYYRTEISGNSIRVESFISGSIQANVGQPIQTASFTYDIGKGSNSLSPLLSIGLKDQTGLPLLRVGQPILFYTATVPPGVDPEPFYRLVFDGNIQRYEMNPEQHTVTIHCRDLFGQLLEDHIIRTWSTTDDGIQYGFPIDAARVDIAMQQVIVKSMTNGPQIQVEGVPDLAISAYWQDGRMGLLEALRRLGVTVNGWDLRGRWDLVVPDRFFLTYYNPDRTKSTQPPIVVTGNDNTGLPKYYSINISSDIANVRNICDVIPANDARVPQRNQDNASIELYGERFAALSEDLSSHIDDDNEAAVLAGIMVQDLSNPPVDIVLDTPYFWPWEVNDLFKPESDGGVVYDADHTFVVSAYNHTFDANGEASTEVSGSLVARSALTEWGHGRKRLNQIRLGEPSGPGFEGDVWFQPDDLTIPTVT